MPDQDVNFDSSSFKNMGASNYIKRVGNDLQNFTERRGILGLTLILFDTVF